MQKISGLMRKIGLVNESEIMDSPIHTGEEACMGTSRVLAGYKTRPIATATLKKLR
jgi:hypothetical protein